MARSLFIYPIGKRLTPTFASDHFFLAHENEIDEYLQRSDADFAAQADARRQKLKASKPELYE